MGCEFNKDMEVGASEEVRLGKHVTWVGFWTNAGLSVLKILAGVFGRSSAMIADGVHSASDLVTDIAVLIVIGVSRKKASFLWSWQDRDICDFPNITALGSRWYRYFS